MKKHLVVICKAAGFFVMCAVLISLTAPVAAAGLLSDKKAWDSLLQGIELLSWKSCVSGATAEDTKRLQNLPGLQVALW
jgi:hypothetical protein